MSMMRSWGCVVLALAFLGLLFGLPDAARPGSAGAPSAGTRQRKPQASGDAATSDWESLVRDEIASREYEITWQEKTALAGLSGAWQAPNRAHGLRTYFTASGIRVVPRGEAEPTWEWGLALVRFGRPGKEAVAQRGHLSALGHRLEHDRDGIVEWYVNDPRGLEQGFTLPAPPTGRNAGRAKGPQE